MYSLIIVHLIGVTIAMIAAMCRIWSIFVSGPPVCLISLAIATLAYRQNQVLTLYYALFAPTVFAFSFAYILELVCEYGLGEYPFSIIFLAISAFINMLLGMAACFESKQPQITKRRKGPFQYSIASVMGLTLVVAISLSLIKTLSVLGIAPAFLLCYLSLVVYVLKRFHTNDLL